MNRRLALILILLGSLGGLVREALGDNYELTDKTVLTGQAVYPDRNGIIIKGEDNKLSERVPWTNLTQSALKQISSLPAAKAYVDLYLEPDDPEPLKRANAEIPVKPVPRLARPAPGVGVGAIFSSSLTTLMFFILYVANIYAAYEISIFRNYPAAMVCGLSAVLPVIGPVIFVSIPTRMQVDAEEPAEQAVVEEPGAVHDPAGEVVAAVEPGAAPPAASAAAAPHHPPATVYRRGQTTFNRRFFETKFAGFLRVVPSDAEKDMVLCIRSSRGEHTGSRISHLMPNEVTLQVHKGGASQDVVIPYSEIQEIQVRHKGA